LFFESYRCKGKVQKCAGQSTDAAAAAAQQLRVEVEKDDGGGLTQSPVDRFQQTNLNPAHEQNYFQ
jgi:hypothetical protein